MQSGNEIEWMNIIQDFLKTYLNERPKRKLPLIIILMKYHTETRKMALMKLHRAIEEEDSDQLTPFS